MARRCGRWVLAALVGISLTGAPAFAQSRSAPPLTLALLDVPVSQALEALSQAASVNLVWQARSLGAAVNTRISCRVTSGDAESLLRCITRSAGLDFYRLSSGTYVVIAAAEAPPGYASLGGVILDAASGAPVPAARITLAERPDAVQAGDDGGFRFPRLRPGRYDVTVRALGYQPLAATIDIEANASRLLRLSLAPTVAVRRPIVVQGIRVGEVSGQLGTSAMGAREEAAVLGPSLWVPGAVAPLGTSRRDGTGDVHLQGGDVGEHPWRLDGVPLYDVSMLSGLLGIVSPAVVEQVQIRRTGARARDGSFAVGVIDLLHALDGDGTPPTAEVALDPLSATVRVSAPFTVGGATGRTMLATRTGLWSWTAPAAMVRAVRHWSVPDPVLLARVSGFAALPGMANLDRTPYASSLGDPAVRLQDVHSATRLSWGASQSLSLSAFSNTSGIVYDGVAPDSGGNTLHTRDDYAWRTLGGQLSHQWLLGTRVRQTVQLRASRHALEHATAMSMSGATPVGLAGGESNAIGEAALAATWAIRASESVELTVGSDVSRTTARLDLANRVLRPLALGAGNWRGSLLADATITLAPATLLDAGIRVTQLNTGRTYAEPRVALRRESRAPGTPWSWRVAAGGAHQFVSQYDIATTMPVAFVPSTRVWLPSDGAIPVAQAWHLAGEAVWRLAPSLELRADAYARWHPALPLVDYGVMYDAPASTSVVGASVIRAMSGQARGAGIRAVHQTRVGSSSWRSELAYDAGWAARRFPSRFGETLQPPPWLEPHRVLLASEVQANAVRVGARARWIGARPWALRQAYYDLFAAAPDRSGLPIEMPGTMRRPAVVEVDAGVSWTHRLAGHRVETALNVANLFNRANVLDFGLRRRRDDAGYEMIPRFLPGRQPALTVHIGR